jgi:TonB family protein
MRGLIAVIALAVSFAGAAKAEDVFKPATVTPTGAPHSCDGFYPESAREAHIGGMATVDFHINPNGTVSRVKVTKSSGNSDLDDASTSCVRTWRYLPVLKSGVAVEAAWTADVEWKTVAVQPKGPLPVLTDRADSCFHYPFWAKEKHTEGTAAVKFQLGMDGLPKDISITRSAGDKDLDDRALECVQSMRFHVTDDKTHNITASATWSTLGRPRIVRWHLDGALGSEAAEAMLQVTEGIGKCLKGAVGHSDFTSGFNGETVIWTRYSRGELEEASILRSSGNDGLDRFALACFKSNPPDSDQAHTIRKIGKGVFPIVWNRVFTP